MLKRFLLLLCLATVLIGAVAFGIYAYQKWELNTRVKAWEAIYNDASEMLAQGQSSEALELLNVHFNPKQADAAQASWPPLMVQAAIDSHAYSQLESLVAKFPAVLVDNESAALWWLRAQMHLNAPEPMQQLKSHWPETRRSQPLRWRLLEADALMREGESELALQQLNSWQGIGNHEVNRQLRIALLAGEDSAAIIQALNAAYVAMPRSAELRAIGAEFLERMGAIPQARRNYIAAFLLDPKNPIYGHLLANFYLRTTALPQAIQTWRDCYTASGDQRAWWQVWFWERVTRPRGEALEPAVAEWWGALTQTLSETEPEAFLSTEFLDANVRAPAILSNSDAYYWLWTLEKLRDQDESGALAVLRNMPIGTVAPELQLCLTALLEWRVEGNWPRGLIAHESPGLHRWLRFLQTYRPSERVDSEEPLNTLDSFLVSDYAVASLLMANGWYAAADRILSDPIPKSLYAGEPALNWLPYADTKIQAALHGSGAGLTRSQAYPDDLAVQGLAGELLLLDGDVEAGLALLHRVRETPGAVGYRAAYLTALAALEKEDWDQFNLIFAQRLDLADAVVGQELQARAALARGEGELAAGIYASLGQESVEGCVFRYRLALNGEEYEAAREILELLIDLAPNEPRFRQWMNELNELDG